MYTIKNEIMDFIQKNNVQLIYLVFCDILGVQKSITISHKELHNAFETGIAVDASFFQINTKQKTTQLLLFPDISTFSILPWLSSKEATTIQFYCNIKYPNGSIFEGDSRYLLKNAVKEAKEQNLNFMFYTKCPFYVLKQNVAYDTAGYMDTIPFDKCQKIRNHICLTLEKMQIPFQSAYHQKGPGQNQIDFSYTSPIQAADYFMTYKTVVSNICSYHDTDACFLPKPFLEENENGISIHLSLSSEQKTEQDHSIVYENFIAGILMRIKEITPFLNTTASSYKRFETKEISKYVAWSNQNTEQLIYIPYINKTTQPFEIRTADACLNPYLAFALFIYAGLEGIAKQISLPSCCNLNLYDTSMQEAKKYDTLPTTLKEAVEISKNSNFIQQILSKQIAESYLNQTQQK